MSGVESVRMGAFLPTPSATPSFSDMSDSQKMLVLSIALTDVQNKVTAHDKLLITGNGVPAIPERIRSVEAYIEGTKYWSRFLVGAILLQTLSFATAAVIYFVKLYPILEKLSTP